MTENETYEDEQGTDKIDTDFNLDDEFKEDPIAPAGHYLGIVKSVKFEKENQSICWTVVATQNEGITLNDGKTSINGAEFYYRNWMPKPGDEKLRTKSGKSTKRQAKINMMKQFAEQMEVNMNTPSAIMSALEDQLWLGIPVNFELKVEEYEGRVRNSIGRMSRYDGELDFPEQNSGEDYDDDIPF